MTTVVLVTGGRDYADADEVHKQLALLAPTLVIAGGCKGADALAEEWAELNGVHCCRIEALWHIHGRAAGPMRNKVMAELCGKLGGMVLAFPGGKGTESMVTLARSYMLPIKEVS